MALSNLHKRYGNRNIELRTMVHQFHEFGRNISESQSAALTAGILSDDLERQEACVKAAEALLDKATAKVPDRASTHPENFPINLTVPYKQFVEDVNGDMKPVNEHTALLAEQWLTLAVNLAKSLSATVSGGLFDKDRDRAKENLALIKTWLAIFSEQGILDLPETVNASAELDESDLSR